ncbi:MAG: hypothetical protein ABSH08_02215 [Tepidisphaeraceae bacterium]|jgi:hypothetical protein
MRNETRLCLAAMMNGSLLNDFMLEEINLKQIIVSSTRDYFECEPSAQQFDRGIVLQDLESASHADIRKELDEFCSDQRIADCYSVDDRWQKYIDRHLDGWRSERAESV